MKLTRTDKEAIKMGMLAISLIRVLNFIEMKTLKKRLNTIA